MAETRFDVGMTCGSPGIRRYSDVMVTLKLLLCESSFGRIKSTHHRFCNTIIFKHHSEGCANAVKRILGKVEGVSDIQTNVEAKTVVVVHDESVSKDDLLAKLQKWSAASGKSVALSS